MRTSDVSVLPTAPLAVAEDHAQAAPVGGDWARRFSTLAAVATIGVSCIVGVVVLTTSEGVDHAFGRAMLHVLAITAPVATGLYAARSGYVRFGRQLVAAGFIWSLAVLGESSSAPPYSAGRVIAWTIFPVLVYLMLAFPSGRITVRRDRLLFAGITWVVGVLFIGSALLVDAYPASSPWTSCGTECPANAFQVVSSEPAWVASVVAPARDMLAALLLLGVTVVLAGRLRTGSVVGRVTTAPVFAVSIASNLALVAFIVARRVGPDSEVAREIGLVWTLSLPALAGAFTLGLVQRRLLITAVLSSLSRSLRSLSDPSQIGAALRSTLGGSDIQILDRDGDRGRWVREDGHGAAGDVPVPGSLLREIRDGSEPVAAIVIDDGLSTDRELVEAVVSLAEAALRETRLKADLQTSLSDLDESRKRIATAADVERRRIERDLHDGAQQRLIALRMRLSLAEDLLRDDPAAATDAIHGLGDDVDNTLEEIRSLAHGIYPALLADRGLADALRSVARRSALRAEVWAAGLRRLPAELESAVYFTCREALQNAAKHAAGATRARVSLDQGSRALTFEVADDGEGFDPSRVRDGSGLRNMRDRIESLGGTLEILSSPGEGTVVRGVVPLTQPSVSASGAVRVPPAV
jgi:signal transduction histidine kinase